MATYTYPQVTRDRLRGFPVTLKYDEDGRLDLRDVDFSNRILDGLDLRHALLDGTKLDRASFRGTKLNGASLVGTDLRDVDFTGAIGLTGAQLAQAKNLEFCIGIKRFYKAIERAGYVFPDEDEDPGED